MLDSDTGSFTSTGGIPAAPPRHSGWRGGWNLPFRGRLGAIEGIVVVLIAGVLARGWLLERLASPRWVQFLHTATVVAFRAVPFLVLGSVVSAAVTAFMPLRVLSRVLPRRPAVAVPVAAVAGVALPTDGLVPVAGQQVRRGMAPAAALAFLLASPAVNPVVLVATAVALPAPMVGARVLAGLLVAMVMGWLWVLLGRPEWLRPTRFSDPHLGRGWGAFWICCRQDLVQGGAVLAIGAFAVAAIDVLLPAASLAAVAHSPVVAVVVLALLAVLLCLPAQVNAFVAAALVPFSPMARLALLVVGPVVDLRRLAAQAATFGPAFAVRVAPVTLVVAVGSAALVGWLVL